VKHAIAEFGLSSTFSYEQGTPASARPTVTASQFMFNAPKPALSFTFSQQVGASVDPSDITVTNLDTGQVIPTSAIALSYDTPTRTLTVTFPGIGHAVLPDGHYSAVVSATGIVGNTANPMASDYTLPFRVLAGDADGNGVINFDDYVAIDNGFNDHLTGFSNGDFNYDGVVNFDDYVIIDLAFNNQGHPAANPGTRAQPVFGGQRIERLVEVLAV
jgi:hypothetical protein